MLHKYGKGTRHVLGPFGFYVTLAFCIWEASVAKQFFRSRLLDDYCQIGTTGLVGYLSSHIQRVLVE